MIYMRYNYRKGFVGYTPKEVKSKSSTGNTIAIYKGGVYDLTNYVTNSGCAPVSRLIARPRN